ncbi:hypothetical protein D3C86_1686950 [compost metagenome]
MAAVQALHGVELGAHPLKILQHHGHVTGEDFTGGRQAQAAGQAVEQRGADFVFQLEDLPVHRRGSDIQAPRRFADGVAVADHVEIVDGRRVEAQFAAHGGGVP